MDVADDPRTLNEFVWTHWMRARSSGAGGQAAHFEGGAGQGEKTFPFPASVHDIYFAEYGEWQEYEFLLRFQAPPEDCLAAIPVVIAWHNHESRQSSNYEPEPLIGRTILPRASSLSLVRWFDSAVIERGVYAGENESHKPNIWVDTVKGIFYIYEFANHAGAKIWAVWKPEGSQSKLTLDLGTLRVAKAERTPLKEGPAESVTAIGSDVEASETPLFLWLVTK